MSPGVPPDSVVASPARSVLRFLPILEQVRQYQGDWLRGDLVAGVVVAALIIPKNLGYAEIAGVPLENGLYAAAAGTILYALFGTCRQISMGPSSGLAAVAGGAVLAASTERPRRRGHLGGGHHADSGLFFLAARSVRGWGGWPSSCPGLSSPGSSSAQPSTSSSASCPS